MKGKNKPTSVDIAHLAGVSQPTVSRALRDSPLVSLETRKRVQRIARELNYKVDVNARNLRSQRTNTLALLLFEDSDEHEAFINPFFLSMLGSITRASAQHGYDLLISFQQLSDDWNAEYEDANKADGIIFLGYGDYPSYIERISKLDQEGAHFVTWGPVIKDQPGLFIGSDNELGGYLAADHLIRMNHTRIAFLGDQSNDYPEFRDRYAGYCRAHAEHGLEVDPRLRVNAFFSEECGYKAAHQLAMSGVEFTAISCASDLIAIGAIKALREHGLRVPRDKAIVGFDDIPTAEHLAPSLTTIQQDTFAAGQALVESVIRSINGEPAKSILLPTRLVVRDSSGAKVQIKQ
ncbi:LacI family transcriptional regulator [Arenicella chitinivorans]|uniref:LacI family transcriptional regulator n=1 Tax=Arenicella chitinivorans TaxID=1329800 RepID=A0A918VIU6_9GAMM|nr:LacI family DNA-binding transcriptional regulator [Arenicella chitinivorans]GHA05040.1 LacI family transcriptional regulator [Arenicella chitinivorans]